MSGARYAGALASGPAEDACVADLTPFGSVTGGKQRTLVTPVSRGEPGLCQLGDRQRHGGSGTLLLRNFMLRMRCWKWRRGARDLPAWPEGEDDDADLAYGQRV
jgi:hypothetical protein